jgi:predicted small lipoprotein YifL
MTEKEMRHLVASVVRRSLRQAVLPAALGLGLSLAGCGSNGEPVGRPDAAYGAPFADTGVLTSKYGAPFPDAGWRDAKVDGSVDAGCCIPAYGTAMADAGQAVTKYMAPFDAAPSHH